MSPTARNKTDEDEQDNWDKAVNSGGCVLENEALLNCKSDTGDWRKCTAQVDQLREVLD